MGRTKLFLTIFLLVSGLFIGSAFAAPVPNVSIVASNPSLLSSDVQIDLAFTNTSGTASDTGYYPILEVKLPAGLECNGSCQSGISVLDPAGGAASVSAFGGYGIGAASYTNPITGESISLAANETLLILTPPLGTISVGQPAIRIRIPTTMTASAAVGSGMNVRTRGIFALGNIPNGTRSSCGGAGNTICQNPQASVTVTPTVLNLQKTQTASLGEATGPQYPRTFQITADVATGAALTNLVIADTIPNDIIVTNSNAADCSGLSFSVAPTSCIYTADASGGGTFSATYASVTGSAGTDITVSYNGYVQRLIHNQVGSPVVSPTTGNTTTSVNLATANFSYLGNAQAQQTASVTIPQRSVHVVKGVSVTDVAPSGNSPGDTLTWTVTTYVSDYFSFDDLVFDDDIKDGQTYVPNSFSMRLVEGTDDITVNGSRTSDAAFGGFLVVGGKDGNGDTHIDLDVSGALSSGSIFNTDARVDGSLTIAASVGSRIVYSYQTTIDEQFVTVPGGVNTTTIDGTDIINNTVDIDYRVLGTGNRQTINGTNASIVIAPIVSVTKLATFKNGSSYTAPLMVAPGDVVTYELSIVIPTGDAENFTVQDYLPSPIFSSVDSDASGAPNAFTKIGQGDTAPNAGEWRYRSTSFVPASESLSTNGNDNSLTFNFTSVVEDGAASASRTIRILFSVEATNQPMDNALQLVNLLFVSQANSEGDTTTGTATSTAALITEQPKLVVTKAARAVISGTGTISSGNFVNVDAGDELEFEVTVQNVGALDALATTVSDTLPAGLAAPIAGLGVTVVDGGGGTACNTGSFTNSSSGNSVSLTGGVVDGGPLSANRATCKIRYRAVVQSSAKFNQTITNLASVTYKSDVSGPIFSPESDGATVTLKSPSVTKQYQNGTSSDAVTSDPNLRSGEAVDFLYTVTVPEGSATSFGVAEVDSGTSNPSADFLQAITSGDITLPAVEQNCANSNAALYNFVGLTEVCFTLDPSANQSQVDTQNYLISFGDIVNLNSNDSSSEQFTITVRPKIKGLVNAGAYTNRADVRWSNGASNQTVTGTASLTVVNPSLTVSKSSLTSGLSALGSTIRYQVTVSNAGNSPAYAVSSLVDTLPASSGSITLVSATYDGSDVTGLGAFSFSNVANVLTISVINGSGNPDIANGKNFVVVYDVVVGGNIIADSISGPGHPGGSSYGPGCVDSIANSADIASFDTGPSSSGSTVTNIIASSVISNLDSDADGISNTIERNGGACSDSDGDGVPDYADTDSDDNGISDATEYSSALDTDGDSSPNYRDTDDDGDGTGDWTEIQNSGMSALDRDADGIPDFRDLDSDNDGLRDTDEGATDADGDGLPNYLDLDSDNDGIPDLIEAGGTDSNSDGRADTLTDTDGDGWVNLYDPTNGGSPLSDPDRDGDSRKNRLDIDSDGDGLTDTYEAGGADVDGDGRLDGTFVDTDVDGLADSVDPTVSGVPLTRPDSDADGSPNYLDTDSDADGISDNIESQPHGSSYRAPLGVDTDGDGLDNRYDASNGGSVIVIQNTESTGQSDWLDLDSDGDGILDFTEGTVDTDSDGIPSYRDLDSDGDGTPDANETSIDTDGDGILDFIDLDSDNDGIPDVIEGTSDSDGDGVPNRLDLDSDNDGILDIIEAGGVDSNGNGRADNLTDTNNDGLVDLYDGASSGTPLTGADTDGDGKKNFLDIDSDADGITDTVEAQVTPLSRIPSGIDSDGDGIDNVFDVNSGGSPLVPVDTDGDLTPDYRDSDSDADGVTDAIEGHDSNHDGVSDRIPSGTDTDGDGLDNSFDTFNLLSPPSSGVNSTGSNSPLQDTDSDGARDWRDTDDDGDTISTNTERGYDSDSDGTPDYLDLDSDGDDVPDQDDGTGDSDGDGNPNYRDPRTCTLSGNLSLPSGETMVDVVAELILNSSQATLYSDQTDDSGNFALDEVEDGSYTLRLTTLGGLVLHESSAVVTSGNCGASRDITAELILKSPLYFPWNGFLRQQNVVVAGNKGLVPLHGTVSLFDVNGGKTGSEQFLVNPKSEKDILVSSLKGFDKDTYGYVKLEFDQEKGMDGHSAQYRFKKKGDTEEFSIMKPFENVLKGTTYLEYNTNQENPNPRARNHQTPQWVQIANLQDSPRGFFIRYYSKSGELLFTKDLIVPAFSRRDIQGGHEKPGIGAAGLIEVAPQDQQGRYLAQFHRYSADTANGVTAPTYSFAMGYTARAPLKVTEYVPVSHGAGAKSRLVLSNVDGSTGSARLVITTGDGVERYNQIVSLNSKQQLHLEMANILPKGATAFAKVTPINRSKFIALSNGYYFDRTKKVTAAYAVPARPIFGGSNFGFVNSFFGMQNWLRISNVTSQAVNVNIIAYSSTGTQLGEVAIGLPAGRGGDYELSSILKLPIPKNSFGLLKIVPSKDGAVIADLIRVKKKGSSVDLAKALGVR